MPPKGKGRPTKAIPTAFTLLNKEAVDGVPPLSWSLSFNGWPAGIISVLGDGIICAGSEGNEDNLRAAILAKMNYEKK